MKVKVGLYVQFAAVFAASGTGANISQAGSLSLQPALYWIEPGPPQWFANALTVRPRRRLRFRLRLRLRFRLRIRLRIRIHGSNYDQSRHNNFKNKIMACWKVYNVQSTLNSKRSYIIWVTLSNQLSINPVCIVCLFLQHRAACLPNPPHRAKPPPFPTLPKFSSLGHCWCGTESGQLSAIISQQMKHDKIIDIVAKNSSRRKSSKLASHENV